MRSFNYGFLVVWFGLVWFGLAMIISMAKLNQTKTNHEKSIIWKLHCTTYKIRLASCFIFKWLIPTSCFYTQMCCRQFLNSLVFALCFCWKNEIIFNFQKQKDKPFLLSETSKFILNVFHHNEIMKYIN